MIDNLQEETESECIESPEYETCDDMPEDSEKLTRLELLKLTGSVIQHLKKKATGGRFSDPDLEKLRDSKMRLLLEAVKAHGSLLKDEQNDELEARIAALEQGTA